MEFERAPNYDRKPNNGFVSSNKRKSDAILWRIREIELSSQIAEMQQHYAELDCLRNVEHASNTLQSHNNHQKDLLSASSSVAPTPEVQRARAESKGNHPMWKDLPPAIMTESIGPLEDLCILPDDPILTGIYANDSDPNRRLPL